MELTKFGAAEVLYHIKHDLRELPSGKSYGNYSIDPDLSSLNYSLIDIGKNAAEVNKYRKNLEKEIFKYNRKNLVHAIEVVIQCPNDCPPSQKNLFFIESFEYIASTLPRGKKDIFIAQVHKDEKHFSPTGEVISKDHIHIMYCPAVKDLKHDEFEYKLCADALTKRASLRRMHPELQAHINSKGIQATVFRKKNGDGKAISLSVKQLKEITEKTGLKIDHTLTINELAQIISNNIELSRKVNELSATVTEQKQNITNLSNMVIDKNKQIEYLQTELKTKTPESTINREKNELQAKLQEKEIENRKIRIEAQRIISNKNIQIESANKIIASKDHELVNSSHKNQKLQEQLHDIQESLKSKELETQKNISKEQIWGADSTWGSLKWGNTSEKSTTIEEEKTYD